MDLSATIQSVSVWLHVMHVSQSVWTICAFVVPSMLPSCPSSPSLPSPAFSPSTLAVTHSSVLNALFPLSIHSKMKLRLAVSIGAFTSPYTSTWHFSTKRCAQAA
ncbi:hypothetical protein SCLCIDRAFT_287568 [Scleroderma citrinum Foug A]|uniref:Uncharacterized protein n=1 Tax=Scleroderma citrinum Foug A TaxID=1036808 RepID=A0A0C2ZT78_9AGAM|nr:hypothetical protein SCLCIDRAFT_287568 [Scleroderma citrinum Foug A]